jgi:hypothetical protein
MNKEQWTIIYPIIVVTLIMIFEGLIISKL